MGKLREFLDKKKKKHEESNRDTIHFPPRDVQEHPPIGAPQIARPILDRESKTSDASLVNLRRPRSSDAIWGPLNSKQKQIRLLRVEPSDDIDDRVRCKLDVVSLDDIPRPHFVALSYACGEALAPHPIEVSGATLSVGLNLAQALRYIRRDQSAAYWIDAICIHQTNLEEKGEQIRLMSRIYASAAVTCIWLGEPTELSSLGMGLLGFEADVCDFLETHGLDEAYALECVSAIEEILSKPWWSRVWTVQEFALSHAAVFMCGQDWFDTRHLISGRTFNRMAVLLATHVHRDGLLQSLLDLASSSLRQVAAVKSLCQSMPGQQPYVAANAFQRIMELCRTRACLDERDKIYALVGLMPENMSSSLQVDYGLSVKDVFTQLTIEFIRQFRSLSLLEDGGICWQPNSPFPSWVCDFRVSRSETPPLWFRSSGANFNAFANNGWSWVVEGHELMLKGVHVGTIRAESLGVICNPEGHQKKDHIFSAARNALYAWIDNLLNKTQPDEPSPYGGQQFNGEAFYRTLRGDIKSTMGFDNDPRSVRLSRADVDDSMLLPSDWERELCSMPSMLDSETMPIPPSLCGRRIFKTDTGFFGNGSRHVMANDQVFVIMGCPYPVVLRQVSTKLSCEKYKLVETCYVHGIMDGELFKDGKVLGVGIEGETVREFVQRTEEMGSRSLRQLRLV